jgi:hypothetical protein
VFQRDAYLQRRRSLIYDGSPPRESERSQRDEGNAAVPHSALETDGVLPHISNVYLPRAPHNYQAVMATVTQNATQP